MIVASRPPGAAAPFLVLGIALLAVSHGAIFARLADAPSLAIAAWRLTLASAVAIPCALVFGARPAVPLRSGRAVIAGLLLALHFAFWIASLERTSIARSVLLVSTSPIWVALFRLAAGNRPSVQVLAALGLAIAGVAVAGYSEADTGGWAGDALALAGAAAMAGYLLAAQSAQRSLPFLRYIGFAYGSAAAFLWLAVAVTGTVASGYTAVTWWALAGMAAISQLIGHSGYNWSLQRLSPLFVAIALVGEPVLASLLGWWLLGEEVGWRTAAGGALILAGILAAVPAARDAD